MSSLEAIAARIAADPERPFLESRLLPVPGEGPAEAHVVFVGDAPGEMEDEAGCPPAAEAGFTRLGALLRERGLR